MTRNGKAHSKVGPGGLKGWIVLLRVEVRVVTWRQRSKQVACDLVRKMYIYMIVKTVDVTMVIITDRT